MIKYILYCSIYLLFILIKKLTLKIKRERKLKMFNKLLIFTCLIIALNFLFLSCDDPNSTSSDSSDSSSVSVSSSSVSVSSSSSSSVSSSSSINIYIIDSLLLENTNINPSDPLNLRELEVYSGSTASGSNVILNSSNISSGAHDAASPPANLVNGIKNTDDIGELYHSSRANLPNANWVSIGFNTSIIVDDSQATNIFIKLYSRQGMNNAGTPFDLRAVGVKIHLFDTNNNIVLSSGGITSGQSTYDFLYNFSTSTVTID